MFAESDLREYGFKASCSKVAKWLGKNIDFQTSYLTPNDNEPDWSELEQETHKFYDIVLKELGGNEIIFNKSNSAIKNKEDVINALKEAGFNVSIRDFKDILDAARAIRNYTKEVTYHNDSNMGQFRHTSLNCYDYDRLKEEVDKLVDEIGHDTINRFCPAILRILAEAAEGEFNKYPGRHLPYNKYIGKTSERYQCLRIMDEILCTSDLPLDNTTMMNLIRKKASDPKYRGSLSNNIDLFEKNISDNTFKHYYAILKDLINVEYSAGKRLKYDRSVYESGHRSGHLYKKYKEVKDNEGRKIMQRLSAFTVDISLPEVFKLRKDIGIIRAKYFYDDRILFAEKYPLISMLGYVEDVITDVDKSKLVNDINTTDLKTVNYKSAKYSTLKATIKDIIAARIPIAITEQGNTYIVVPQEIKEDGDNWVLVASDIDKNKETNKEKIRVFSPAMLSKTCEYVSQRFDSENSDLTLRHKPSQASQYIIGIGQLKYNEPYDVQIELTKKGADDISNPKSPLNQLQPEIYKKTIFDDRDSKYIASFSVYINDDFLEELLQLDKAAKLIDIKPAKVKETYESYFEDHMGIGKTPFSRKRLKRPKANKEQEQSDTNPIQDTTPPTLE